MAAKAAPPRRPPTRRKRRAPSILPSLSLAVAILSAIRVRPVRGFSSSSVKPSVAPSRSPSSSLRTSVPGASNADDGDPNGERDELCSQSLRVGVAGCGSVALGTACLAASRGHRPVLWSPSGKGTEGMAEGTKRAGLVRSTGALEGEYDVEVARTARELVRMSHGIVLLALPANGHRAVMDALAPEIAEFVVEQQQQQQQQRRQKHQETQIGDEAVPATTFHVIISSHASLGAVYLLQRLDAEGRERGLEGTDDVRVKVTAWGTTAVAARKTSESSVHVLTLREAVDCCTAPSIPPDVDGSRLSGKEGSGGLLSDGRKLCERLFGPRFRHREGGLLAITLSNLNPQNHLGIVLGNMSRMDPAPVPPPPMGWEPPDGSKQPPSREEEPRTEPWYQGANVTPNVGRLMEALDGERLAIAEALGVRVRNIREHFSWSFHVPMETPVEDAADDAAGEGAGSDARAGGEGTPKATRPLTVSEMNQQMHRYLGNDVFGPTSPNTRYVTEDVPYGLVPITTLGRLAGKPARLHEAGFAILEAMYGRDFREENDLWEGLGLDAGDDRGEEVDVPDLEEWREMAYTGRFSR